MNGMAAVALLSRRRPPQLQGLRASKATLIFSALAYVCHCISSLPARHAAFAKMQIQRRDLAIGVGPLIGGIVANQGLALAEEPTAAPGGTIRLERTVAESGLENWKDADYEAMRDDTPRTQGYEEAIQSRIASLGKDVTVVDIGTGSFALLAIMAAKAGARKVYALEKNIEAAKKARETVAKMKLQDVIEVIEGDSMSTELPEKVDLIVSELIGSIATQEGVEPIIKDATKRFVKESAKGSCGYMIPARTQTLVAPVRYTNHRAMKFAAKRGVMSRGKPEPGTLRPLRLRGKSNDIKFLSEPQVLEDFDFCFPDASAAQEQRKVTFDIPAEKAEDAKDFSGFAMWTRLVIDESHDVQVRGQKQTSHWAYVVALMADLPTPIPAPGKLTLDATIDYAASPVRYNLVTEVPAGV
eukprot:TRINITY_DN80593_c0_g1_i1.p1 TRINITY_DN80593_c0_g1~~TRINITY_DN80593_c0_g1_i1.p1  ORF type:complete len:413 (+),score=96.25 TRINITY_DN80593_c0_g1_i1:52-1290(+)